MTVYNVYCARLGGLTAAAASGELSRQRVADLIRELTKIVNQYKRGILTAEEAIHLLSVTALTSAEVARVARALTARGQDR